MLELSEREQALLDALKSHRTVKDASYFLRSKQGMSDMTDKKCYDILGRLRKRYLKARTYVNTILNYRQASSALKKVLTPKIAVKEEEIEEDEERIGLL